jgi:peptidoglycan-associated lipoprotein
MKVIMRLAVLAVVVLSLLTSACAKRPFVPVAAAPPPTETRAPAPPPAPAPAPAPPPVVVAPPPAPAPTPPPAAPTPPPVVAAPAPQPPKEFRHHDALKQINFDFDQAKIRPGDAKILDANAAWLRDNENYLLLIEGHCDERGTNEYNLALGDRRAKATMNYLMAQGVKVERMSMISYGEERTICTESNEGCWARNRRAEFLIKER